MNERVFSNCLIKPVSGGRWQCFDYSVSEFFEVNIERYKNIVPDGVKWILVLPAEEVLLRNTNFDDTEKKLLQQTVPYQLEAELSVDVEQLHFALGEVGQQTVDAAIVDRQQLRAWLNTLSEYGYELCAAVPEQLLLPWREQQWTIVEATQGYLIRHGQSRGFSVDQDKLKLSLELLSAELSPEFLPESVQIYASEVNRAVIEAAVPLTLGGQCEWQQRNNCWQLCTRLCSDDVDDLCSVNLLQGEFKPALPWGKWQRQWQAVAALAVLAVTLQLGFSFVQNMLLKQDILALNQQIEQVYREVVPRGRVVDAERQLRRKVNNLKGEGGSRFIPIYKTVAEVIDGTDGIRMHSMSFNNKKNALRITLEAPGFNSIEALRAKLESNDVGVEVSGIQNERGKSRARLVIRG